ncbi:MAG: hypothetical protein AAFQ58_12130 [Pseudomonadota bacterium]
MLRLILSMVLAVALKGAAVASVAHGWSGDAGSAHVHAEALDSDEQPHHAGAFSDCCDAPASNGAGHCLSDIAVSVSLLSMQPDVSQIGYLLRDARYPDTATLNVPTGPPKA